MIGSFFIAENYLGEPPKNQGAAAAAVHYWRLPETTVTFDNEDDKTLSFDNAI